VEARPRDQLVWRRSCSATAPPAGQKYTKTIVGVAHRTLPCGTKVQFRYNGTVLTVPVIDRGPVRRLAPVRPLLRGVQALGTASRPDRMALPRALTAPLSARCASCRRRRRRRQRRCPDRARRAFFEQVVVADYDPGARRACHRPARWGPRFVARRVDARTRRPSPRSPEHGSTHVLNAVDPRFVLPIFEGALQAGADYLDMAMSLSRPDASAPYERTGVKLG
jgi:hypothetical protein